MVKTYLDQFESVLLLPVLKISLSGRILLTFQMHSLLHFLIVNNVVASLLGQVSLAGQVTSWSSNKVLG